MKKIDGYVCVSTCGEYLIYLFGKKVDEDLDQCYENIESNGFTLYENEKEAMKGKKELEQRGDIVHTRLAKLKMDIAENEKDLEELLNETSLVAIKHSPMGDNLMGTYIEGNPGAYPLPGAYLRNNGLRTFDNFDSAEITAREIIRQGQCKAGFAKFVLEYLNTE